VFGCAFASRAGLCIWVACVVCACNRACGLHVCLQMQMPWMNAPKVELGIVTQRPVHCIAI